MMYNWNNYLINENLQKARSILRKLDIPETNEDFKELREILSKAPGYLGKFTEWLFVQKKSIESLRDLYKKITDSKISKPINEFDTPEDVIDYIIRDTSDTAVNQIVNSIPSRARNFLKSGGCNNCDNGKEECENCKGNGYFYCTDCKKDEDCEECDDDGMVGCEECDARFDYTNGCEECDAEGEHVCGNCDGEGGVECKNCDGKGCDECDGSGNEECNDCDGKGRSECESCGGTGEVRCSNCKGKGEVRCSCRKDCKSCKNTGKIDCKNCKDGYIDCKDCKDGITKQWRSFLGFLKIHADKKEIICDFFSKKGGRYSDSNYDSDDALDSCKDDITKLLDLGDIDTIKKRANGNKDVMEIYEDDDIYVLASNWEGLQKFGSSYWCITEDEDTFNDYVYNDKDYSYYDSDEDEDDIEYKQQWIIYFKNKMPLIDDKSVMGMTVNIEDNNIIRTAAHWEDDSPSGEKDVNYIISKLKNSITNIQKAFSIFKYHKSILIGKFPYLFKDEIKDIINSLGKKNKIKNIDWRLLCETFDINYDLSSDEDYTLEKYKSSLAKIILNILKEEDIHILISYKEVSVKNMRVYHEINYFIKYAVIHGWINRISIDDKNILEAWIGNIHFEDLEYLAGFYKWVKSMEADLSKVFKDDDDDFEQLLKIKGLIKSGFPDIIITTKYYRSINKWNDVLSEINSQTQKKLFIEILKNDKKYIIDNTFYAEDSILKYISIWVNKTKTNLSIYKKDIIEVINMLDNNRNSRNIINDILEETDDDDIETACTYKLLHPRIKSKYDFQMKRRLMENLVYWDKFKH